MSWIFLSPHFDDAALSCGGLIWELTNSGIPVNIWTVCGREPDGEQLSPFAQELHARWEIGQNEPVMRRHEDLLSCQRLGAKQRYFSIPDCIYRSDPRTGEFMYTSEEALNGTLQPWDQKTIQIAFNEMKELLMPEDTLVCPLGLGNHVDHQLTRRAAEGLRKHMWYYADYPYVLSHAEQLNNLVKEGWDSKIFQVTSAGLKAWIDSISAHASQISTFWPGVEEMEQAISDYQKKVGGIVLWQRS